MRRGGPTGRDMFVINSFPLFTLRRLFLIIKLDEGGEAQGRRGRYVLDYEAI